MSKERAAHILTIGALVGALAIGLIAKMTWRTSPSAAAQDPQSAVYSMLDAARAGDVNRYLASYTGPMQASLRQSIAETTTAGFSKYLQTSNAAVKGVAVADPQTISDGQAKIRVEYVYQDHNEVQTMLLEKGPSGWRIARTEGDEQVNALIPYGTPVK